MGAYHQMGHHTENLIFESALNRFAGAILSPVNYPLTEVMEQVKQIRIEKSGFDVIFDSQLYVPQSERGELPKWPHFPQAVDTSDMSDMKWWKGVIEKIVSTASAFTPNAICSPAYLPKTFSNAYYDQVVRMGAELARQLKAGKTRPVQTLLVSMSELTDTARALEIASIASKAMTRDIYLILDTNVAPRRELPDGDGVRGAMVLVVALARAGYKVLVGFCASDIVMWKAAGAAAGATGKFFNLRRFTRSRWDEALEGGQNLPYWFEEGLLAFVRESDLVRLRQGGKLSAASLANPYAAEIFQALDAKAKLAPGEKPPAWVGLGWRQYMHWFADAEARLEADAALPAKALAQAEATWIALEDDGFFMEERRNDGTWLRLWRRALSEFQKVAL